MKFLLDANLSPALIGPLSDAGYDAVHVADLGLCTPLTTTSSAGQTTTATP